jgi:hypothetical protein
MESTTYGLAILSAVPALFLFSISVRSLQFSTSKSTWTITALLGTYRLPLARLWVMQSIWQLSAELPPPLLHAATWSASISSKS